MRANNCYGVFLALVWSATATAQDGPLLFHASFDEGLDASLSNGSPEAFFREGLQPTAGQIGHAGEAVPIRENCYLGYDGEGNFNPRKGAVLAWIKPEWEQPGGQYVVNIFGRRGAGQFLLFFYSDGRLSLRVYDESGQRSNLGSSLRLEPGQWLGEWHEVGFTYDLDSSVARLLVDGRVDSVGELSAMPDLTGKDCAIGIGYYVNMGTNQFNGLIDEVRIYSDYSHLPGVAATTVRRAIQNGGFEAGSKHWSLKPAEDYAKIEVVEDVLAPEGRKVLHIRHDRTRLSNAIQSAQLEPYSPYLFSVEARAENYLRTGMGLFTRVFADGGQFGARYWESQISEEWRTYRFPFVTGKTGRAQIHLLLHNCVGDVWIDNVRVRKCSRAQLRRIMGAGYGGTIPRVPLRPGRAEARVWYDEVPVSMTVSSNVTFQIRQALAKGAWEQSGRLCVELPGQIQITHETVKKEDAKDGYVRYAFGAGAMRKIGRCYWCSMDLLLREEIVARKARFWAAWDGGQQEPVEVDILTIDVPSVSQPREIITGTTCYTQIPPRYQDYPKLIKSLGFNRINFWKLGAGAELIPALTTCGIAVDTEYSGLGDVRAMLKEVEDANSIDTKGRARAVIDASHRGRIFEQCLADVRRFAEAGFSGIIVDDEHYNDWSSIDTCLCDRCKTRWQDWLPKNRPGLAPLMPAVFLDDPLSHRDHYHAWWLFRASLVKEWYQAVRETFVTAVAKRGGSAPWLALQVSSPGFDHIKSNFLDPLQLADVFDLFMPQFYADGHDVRHRTRELVKEVGHNRACPTLCMGTARSNRFEWRPGEIRAQILETLFAGARGYTTWSWPYSNLRIIAEVAQTNGVIADNEEAFLQGKPTTRFWTEQERRLCSAIETERVGLALISNYAKTDDSRVLVRRRPGPPLTLVELFTGKRVELIGGQQSFFLEIAPGTCTLWRWGRPTP